MSGEKRTFYYGRAGTPVSEKLRRFNIPESLNPKREAILEVLSHLDSKPYISTHYLQRMVWTLDRDMGLGKDLARDLIAQRFGYAHYSGLNRSKTLDEEHHKRRAREPGIQAQLRGDMRSGTAIARSMREEKRAKEKAERKLLMGELGGPSGGVKHKTYFFFRQPGYVEAIEKLMLTYNDCYLQAAVDSYPAKMDQDVYYTSFGLFWREVLKLQTSKKIDFSIPGLLLIKQLSHYLYSWNFRRYMADEVIARYAPFLPRHYRCLHVAAVRDRSLYRAVDKDYVEKDIEEDTNVLDTTPHNVAGE